MKHLSTRTPYYYSPSHLSSYDIKWTPFSFALRMKSIAPVLIVTVACGYLEYYMMILLVYDIAFESVSVQVFKLIYFFTTPIVMTICIFMLDLPETTSKHRHLVYLFQIIDY